MGAGLGHLLASKGVKSHIEILMVAQPPRLGAGEHHVTVVHFIKVCAVLEVHHLLARRHAIKGLVGVVDLDLGDVRAHEAALAVLHRLLPPHLGFTVVVEALDTLHGPVEAIRVRPRHIQGVRADVRRAEVLKVVGNVVPVGVGPGLFLHHVGVIVRAPFPRRLLRVRIVRGNSRALLVADVETSADRRAVFRAEHDFFFSAYAAARLANAFHFIVK
mmetsp:Transcript_39168/g.122526  ORF Transcript_39168/g.122526 Transcript_39168/m.122526 type:complete len:217 (-) Transcript_39168:252-902(-)